MLPSGRRLGLLLVLAIVAIVIMAILSPHNLPVIIITSLLLIYLAPTISAASHSDKEDPADAGVAPGINTNTVSRSNVMSPEYLQMVDRKAFERADRRAADPRAPPRDSGAPPLLDGQLEPRKLFLKAIQLTDGKEFGEAAWLFLVALLMDWALNASDMSRPIQAADALPAGDACGIVLRALVKMFRRDSRAPAFGSFTEARAPLLTAIRELAALPELKRSGGQQPPEPSPASLAEQHRVLFANCCAHVFLGRFDCHQGPYTPAAWEAARRLIVKGIRSVDPERYLALQYELAYTARDIGNNRLALEWYDKMLANAERLAAPSEHWRTFFGRVRKEARQLHFEQETGLGPGGHYDRYRREL
mmetsp:Transcript_40136/g.132836  ORF Transcript_40136/g.132836 Transcript_40136/m.132836 type:complete len:361 (+) Transcript_40136:151-1233(+)